MCTSSNSLIKLSLLIGSVQFLNDCHTFLQYTPFRNGSALIYGYHTCPHYLLLPVYCNAIYENTK